MTAATLTPASVSAFHTDDGMVVRLAGTLGADALPQLRASLLRPRPAGCDDVVVDGGAVEAADDDALAVLVAAGAWAADTGGRLSFSRVSEPLRRELSTLGLTTALPVLPPAGQRADREPVVARTASAT